MSNLKPSVFKEFSRRSPDWLYVCVKGLLWLLLPSKRAEYVWLLPHSSGYWLAVRNGKKLLVPSPKGDWRSFIIDRKKEQLVDQGDIVVEVGACVGSFALSVANKADRVIAIEPEPKNLACLRANIKGYKNIKVVGKAAWSSKGTTELHYTSTITGHTLLPTIFSGHQAWKPLIEKSVKVRTDTLDNILAELDIRDVNVLMINAEGADFEILKGAEKTLETSRKVIAEHQDTSVDEICRFLKERGFKVSTSVISGMVYGAK